MRHQRDVLINDRRSSDVVVTHVASHGNLLNSEGAPKLLLKQGSVQRFSPEGRTLSTIEFDSLSYDLSQFAKDVGERYVSPRELFSWQLPGFGTERARLELHDRFVKSLLAIVVPVLGAIVLLSAGFSRAGFFLRIALGVVFMVGINTARGMVQGWVEGPPGLTPLLYLPVIIAFLAIFLMVRMGQAPWKSGIKGVLRPGAAERVAS